jgi:hypothetical protein
MKRVLTHLVFITIALAITLVGLNFWGDFGHVMGNLAKQKDAVGRARGAEQATPGEVTVGIVPATPAQNKPACDKKRPCP